MFIKKTLKSQDSCLDIMKRCIICKEFKDEKDFSKEHIIPEALEGSLIIDNVCRDCNSFLGATVDSILTNNFFADNAKYRYRLKGNKNKIKDPFGLAKIKDSGLSGVWNYDEKTDKSYFKSYPMVDIKDDGKIKVNCGKNENPEKIINIINKKLRRMNKTPLTSERENKIRNNIKNIKKKKNSGNEMEGVLEVPEEWSEPFIKIAYEIGHYLLGEKYFQDPIGENLRKVLINAPNKSFKKYDIKWKTLGPVFHENDADEFFEPLNKFPFNLICVFRDNSVIGTYIRILNALEGIVIISESPEKYPSFKLDGYFIIMDIKNKKTTIHNSSKECFSFIIDKIHRIDDCMMKNVSNE